jgi:hypothetical protein
MEIHFSMKIEIILNNQIKEAKWRFKLDILHYL